MSSWTNLIQDFIPTAYRNDNCGTCAAAQHAYSDPRIRCETHKPAQVHRMGIVERQGPNLPDDELDRRARLHLPPKELPVEYPPPYAQGDPQAALPYDTKNYRYFGAESGGHPYRYLGPKSRLPRIGQLVYTPGSAGDYIQGICTNMDVNHTHDVEPMGGCMLRHHRKCQCSTCLAEVNRERLNQGSYELDDYTRGVINEEAAIHRSERMLEASHMNHVIDKEVEVSKNYRDYFENALKRAQDLDDRAFLTRRGVITEAQDEMVLNTVRKARDTTQQFDNILDSVNRMLDDEDRRAEAEKKVKISSAPAEAEKSTKEEEELHVDSD